MEPTFKNAMETQCKQEQVGREVLEAWINDSLLSMSLCDYCVRDSVSKEECGETFKWNGKQLER